MASKKKLKKTIQYIGNELAMEVMFKSLLAKEDITEKTDKLLVEISTLTGIFLEKINQQTKNEVPAKEYFRKLFADWDDKAEKIVEKIEQL